MTRAQPGTTPHGCHWPLGRVYRDGPEVVRSALRFRFPVAEGLWPAPGVHGPPPGKIVGLYLGDNHCQRKTTVNTGGWGVGGAFSKARANIV